MTTTRVFLEDADRPPPGYFEKNDVPLKVVPFQTPDPEKWLNAPEFVPRSKRLADAFDSPASVVPQSSNQGFIGYPPPLVPFGNTMVPPLDGIPPGYTANMTTINPTNGPPIAAILLRKKRKRRSKQQQQQMVNENLNHSISPCSSHPSDPNADITSDEDSVLKNQFGSCPDLSNQQLQKWDDYLYETVKNANQNGTYEVPSNGILEVAKETISGTANKELQALDNEINGNQMTSSMVLNRLANHTFISDGSTEKTLADEMNDLTFRPQITRYGYPQIDCNESPYVHITSIDPSDKNRKIKNSLIDKDALKAYLDEEAEEEEDFLEGLNITVNNFDNCEDLTLSDIEQPTRFQQIQEAIRKNTIVISSDLQAPDRVCCSIM